MYTVTQRKPTPEFYAVSIRNQGAMRGYAHAYNVISMRLFTNIDRGLFTPLTSTVIEPNLSIVSIIWFYTTLYEFPCVSLACLPRRIYTELSGSGMFV